MIDFAAGSLIEVRDRNEVIAHQCNCVTRGRGAGIAREIFRAFPYSDIYAGRRVEDFPGTITVCHPGQKETGPIVVNLLAQFYPGKPRSGYDTPEDRLSWLSACLLKMLDSVASPVFHFPFAMGCNLAGGDWAKTLSLMEGLASEKGKVFKFHSSIS
jgi:hypothetical protein